MIIDEIKDYIKSCDAVLITAGAGIGIDSGLPDFRGQEGFWNTYPKAKELNIRFSQLANPQWFYTNPKIAWAFYGHRFNLYKNTIPHKGFYKLLDLVKQKNDNYFIYTSNVDGQFQKAGFDEDKIMECHGSISYFQCLDNCKNDVWKNEKEISLDFEKFEANDIPKCIHCESIARPSILMFNDWDWNSKISDKQKYRFRTWLKEVRKSKAKVVIIEIGAGKVIPTIRNLGHTLVKNHIEHFKLIRINPRDFEIDDNIGYSLKLGGLEGINKILN